MRKRRIVPMLTGPLNRIPDCPDCKHNREVIRMGVRWACRKHLMVNVGRPDAFGHHQQKPLGEVVGNRALRRQNMRSIRRVARGR